MTVLYDKNYDYYNRNLNMEYCDCKSMNLQQIFMGCYVIVITYLYIRQVMNSTSSTNIDQTRSREPFRNNDPPQNRERHRSKEPTRSKESPVSNNGNKSGSETTDSLSDIKVEHDNNEVDGFTIIRRNEHISRDQLNLLDPEELSDFNPGDVASAIYQSVQKGDGKAQQHIFGIFSKMGKTLLDECREIVEDSDGNLQGDHINNFVSKFMTGNTLNEFTSGNMGDETQSDDLHENVD